MTNETVLCQITKTVTSSIYYWIILSVEFIFSLTGFVFNLFVMILIKHCTTLHINIRLLLGHLCLSINWFCIAIAFRTLQVTVTAIVNPCYLIMENVSCKLLDLTNAFPLLLTLYVMAAIGCERLYASYKFRTYEIRKSVCPAVLLILIVWSFCIVEYIYGFLNLPPSQLTPICMGIMEIRKKNAEILISIGACLEVFASVVIVVNFFIHKHQLNNLYINQAQHNLTARFQLYQNVKMNRMMLAVMVTHLIFWTLDSFYLIFILQTVELNILKRSCLLHYGNLFILIYGNCNPIVSVWHNVLLQKEMKKYSPKIYFLLNKFYTFKLVRVNNECCRIQPELNSIEKHLEIIENAWNETQKKLDCKNRKGLR